MHVWSDRLIRSEGKSGGVQINLPKRAHPVRRPMMACPSVMMSPVCRPCWPGEKLVFEHWPEMTSNAFWASPKEKGEKKMFQSR